MTGIDLAPVTHVRRAGDGLIVLVSFASLAATSPRGQAWVTERLCLDNLRITGADAAAIRCTGDFLETHRTSPSTPGPGTYAKDPGSSITGPRAGASSACLVLGRDGPARGLAGDPAPVNRHPQFKPGVRGIVLWGRPHAQPVRAASGAGADQVEGLRALPGLGCRVMLEEHEEGPVPASELGPDLPGRLGDRGRRAGLGDHGQVARLRTSRPPHPEVSNTSRSVVPAG